MMRSTELCEMSRSCQSATFSIRRDHVRTHEPRQAADLFARHGIAFVRHRGTAALLAAEWLFDFAHFGALQMANLQRDFFERRGDQRERAEILRVAVALNHLRSDWRNAEPKPLADALLRSPGRDAKRCRLRRKFFRRPFARRRRGSGDVALIFRKPVRDFQSEGDRLGMNSVRAPDLRRVAKFVRAQVEDFAKNHQIALDDLRSIANLQRLRGVDDVVRRHAIVQPARRGGIADRFADVHGERDHVVLHARFDFVDARDVDFGLSSRKVCSGVLRHEAGFGERFRRGQLDLEPLGVFVGVAPDAAHFLAGITWNQFNLLRMFVLAAASRSIFPSIIPYPVITHANADRLR